MEIFKRLHLFISYLIIISSISIYISVSLCFAIESPDPDLNAGGFGLDTHLCLLLENSTSAVDAADFDFLPERCRFLNTDVSRSVVSRRSCCSSTDSQQLDHRVENVISQLYAPLYTCDNLISPIRNSGYSLAPLVNSSNGSTPDLQTDPGTDTLVEGILDTRFYAKLCAEHVAALQCIRCSRDQRSVLGREGFEGFGPGQYNTSINPLFFMQSSQGQEQGKGYPLVLCEQYANKLFDFCRFVNIRGLPFMEQIYLDEQTKTHFVGITQESGLPEGIKVKPYRSTDDYDMFLISNVNCYTRDIPTYTKPKCTSIINKQWSTHYINAPNEPGNGSPSSANMIQLQSIFPITLAVSSILTIYLFI